VNPDHLPDAEPNVADRHVETKANLSRVERARTVLAKPFFLAGLLLLPKAIKEDIGDARMTYEEE